MEQGQGSPDARALEEGRDVLVDMRGMLGEILEETRKQGREVERSIENQDLALRRQGTAMRTLRVALVILVLGLAVLALIYLT